MSDSLGPYGLVACQAPLSMEFSRQEYGSGLPFPFPGDLPNLVFCIAGRFFTIWATREACNKTSTSQNTVQKGQQHLQTLWSSDTLCETAIFTRFKLVAGCWKSAAFSWKWQPIPVFLPGEFHGQRSLAGYTPWGPKESDTTERLTLSLSLFVACFLLKVEGRKYFCNLVGDTFFSPQNNFKMAELLMWRRVGTVAEGSKSIWGW